MRIGSCGDGAAHAALGEHVRAEVSDVTGAIYEILHTNGDEVPFPFPGARPITGMIWFLEVGEAMPVEYHNHPMDPFAVAGEADDGLLYAHRHIYMPSPGDFPELG